MPGAWAEPSFDCAKAQSISEKEVCRVPELQWFDRQVSRLYAEVRTKGGSAVVADQRAFLARREACGVKLACLEGAYGDRLKGLGKLSETADPAAEFRPASFGGSLWVVRYGGLTGAIQILTVGDGGHTCVFETDNATQTGKGVLKAVEAVDEGTTCRLDVIPDEHNLRVETHNCQSYCGMRAIMDGLYRRAGP
jgi:uncharacterized protein